MEFYANARIPEFPWGPVVNVYELPGLPAIIEHHHMIYKNGCGTDEYEKVKTEFCLAIPVKWGNSTGHRWASFDTLERALIGAVTYARTGGISAVQRIDRLLEKPED